MHQSADPWLFYYRAYEYSTWLPVLRRSHLAMAMAMTMTPGWYPSAVPVPVRRDPPMTLCKDIVVADSLVVNTIILTVDLQPQQVRAQANAFRRAHNVMRPGLRPGVEVFFSCCNNVMCDVTLSWKKTKTSSKHLTVT